MKFNIIALTARSLTAELENDAPFYAAEPYGVLLNGELVLDNKRENIFSLFGLFPDTEYTLTVRNTQGEHSRTIRTQKEFVKLNVRKFGASGNGKKADTAALQAAIYACPPNGTVYVPAGHYLTGPLFMKSGLTLYLEKDAVLLGLTEPKDYPILPGMSCRTDDENEEYYLGNYEGHPLDCYASLITGLYAENISIIGEGTLDGNAHNAIWWQNPKVKRDAWRPRTVFFNGCKNVLLQGVTVQNSPSWTIHPCFTDNLRIIDVRVYNPTVSPNTDGINPDSCRHVEILGAQVSVGDDCISAKSGKIYLGKKYKTPLEDMTVRNCYIKNGHGAVVVGSDIAGGVRSLRVSQCIFEKTEKGLRIKSRRGRGKDSVVDDIRFRDIVMDQVPVPFVLNMYYFCDPDGKSEYVWSKEKLPVDDWTPITGGIKFENIRCTRAEHAAAFFYGLPEAPAEEISMTNVHVSFEPDAKPGIPAMMSHLEPMVRRGIIAHFVRRLVLKNVTLSGYEGAPLEMTGVEILEGGVGE